MDFWKIVLKSQTIWSAFLLLTSVVSWSCVIDELKDYEGKDRLQFNCRPKQIEFERQHCYDSYTSALSPLLTPLDFARITLGLSLAGWLLITLTAVVMLGRISRATDIETQHLTELKKQFKHRFICHICFQSVLLVVMIVLFCCCQKIKYPAEYSCFSANTTLTSVNQVAVNITCNDLRYREKSNLNIAIVGIYSASILLCFFIIIHLARSEDELLDLLLGKMAPDLNIEDNEPLQVTVNRQQTAGANGTNPGAQPASELSSPSNGPDDEDGDTRASDNDDNNCTQQPSCINSPPVHVDQDDGHTRTGEERDHPRETVSEKDKSLLDDLAVELDKTAHRVVKDWEYLANSPEINAPLYVWLRCRIRTEGSCTLLLFDVLRAEFAKKTLGNMIDALEEIKRRDVKRIITDCMNVYPNAAVYRTMNFWEFDVKNRQLVRQMAVMLDQKSLVNNDWRHLGGSSQFKLTELRLEEIEQSAKIGGQPTQILMAYLYSEVQNLTIKTFYDVIKNFKKPRKDVLKKLDQFMDENPIFRDSDKHMKEAIDLHGELMRDICVLFNKKIPGANNWRHLAEAFGVPEEVKKDCEPGKPKSPTETLFQWILAEKDPPLTEGQLCKALEGIKRIDLVNVVKAYFKKKSTRQPRICTR